MLKEKKISVFKSTKSTEVLRDQCIGEILELLSDPESPWFSNISKLRKGNEEVKPLLPMFAFHGLFDAYRNKSQFYESTGLIIIDIDDVIEDIDETKQDIFNSFDHVFAAMISPSGTGIKLLVHIDENLVTTDNYREIGKIICKDFEGYGKIDTLSITDCLIATYDPNILVRSSPSIRRVYLKEFIKQDVKLDPLDKNREIWDDPEEFYERVLYDNIANKSDNNYHFIQISLFDLARFGFTHPKYDLTFVIDYAEAIHKRSGSNKQRFDEAARLATEQMPQNQWPYKIIRDDGEEYEAAVDLTPYMQKAEDIGELEDESGLINYKDFMDRIFSVIKEGDRVGDEISLKNFSQVFRFKGSGILTVTGIPGHGKTEFVDQIIIDLARIYGKCSLIAGYEQSPEEHIIKLTRKCIGVDITCPSFWNEQVNIKTIRSTADWIISRISHIDTSKIGSDINKLIDVMAKWIKDKRDKGENPGYVILDPFNMLSIKGKLSGHEKIEEILRRLTMFSHQMGVMVILIAHPFKMKKDEKTGMYEIPDFYSVKGSSAFFEMSYHGICVYRRGGIGSTEVLVRILKVKQNNLGMAGADVFFNYMRPSGRYIPLDDEGNELAGDHYEKDWLKTKRK